MGVEYEAIFAAKLLFVQEGPNVVMSKYPGVLINLSPLADIQKWIVPVAKTILGHFDRSVARRHAQDKALPALNQ